MAQPDPEFQPGDASALTDGKVALQDRQATRALGAAEAFMDGRLVLE